MSKTDYNLTRAWLTTHHRQKGIIGWSKLLDWLLWISKRIVNSRSFQLRFFWICWQCPTTSIVQFALCWVMRLLRWWWWWWGWRRFCHIWSAKASEVRQWLIRRWWFIIKNTSLTSFFMHLLFCPNFELLFLSIFISSFQYRIFNSFDIRQLNWLHEEFFCTFLQTSDSNRETIAFISLIITTTYIHIYIISPQILTGNRNKSRPSFYNFDIIWEFCSVQECLLEIYLSIRARMFSDDIMTTGILLRADEPCFKQRRETYKLKALLLFIDNTYTYT